MTSIEKNRPTQRAADGGDSARLISIFFPSGLYCSQAFVYSRPRPPLTQAVETVEKVPFQKMIFEKWDRNTEKHLVFCILSNILAIFEPVVGGYCEHFSN